MFEGTEGRNVIVGTRGVDLIDSKGGSDQNYGDAFEGDVSGNDELYGDYDEGECQNDNNKPVPCYGGSDFLHGNAGDNLLHGGVENDFGDGGANFDTCVLVETASNCEA